MPGRAFQIVYPNGDFEIDVSGQHPPPAVGDTIRRNGKQWKVKAAVGAQPIVVRVEAAPERAEDKPT